MAGPRLQDLPAAAQDMLRDLDHHGASLLAIDAHHARDRDRRQSYPVDPIEALRAARKAWRQDVEVRVDDPVGLALDTFEVAIAALSRGAFDDRDASALVTVMSLADQALRQYRANADDAGDRLHALTHPQK